MIEFDDACFLNGKRVFAQHIGDIGLGLFSRDHFHKGETVLVLRIFDPEYTELLTWEDSFAHHGCQIYGITFAPGYSSYPKPNSPFRYINHSCNPNSGLVNWGALVDDMYLPIVAYRDIPPLTQVTLDYATITPPYDGSAQGDPWELAENCLCGEPNCRQHIGGINSFSREALLDLMLMDINGASGPMLGFALEGMDDVLAEFAARAPGPYAGYLTALETQKRHAALAAQHVLRPAQAAR